MTNRALASKCPVNKDYTCKRKEEQTKGQERKKGDTKTDERKRKTLSERKSTFARFCEAYGEIIQLRVICTGYLSSAIIDPLFVTNGLPIV